MYQPKQKKCKHKQKNISCPFEDFRELTKWLVWS